MHTCRFCKKDIRGKALKYSTRHWAHYECWIQWKGGELKYPWEEGKIVEWLTSSLHAWQIRELPVFVFAEFLRLHMACGDQRPVDTAMDLCLKAIGILEAKEKEFVSR